MHDDGLGDWRMHYATLNDPDSLGNPLYLVTVTSDAHNPLITFITPSGTALALSIAMKASTRAQQLRTELVVEEMQLHVRSVQNIDMLYDYFEDCLIAVTFSFQALESFCNYIIESEVKGTLEIQRNKEMVTLTSLELERTLRTDEKLATVLPKLLGIATPKGRKEWPPFRKLKAARDATIHLKSLDQYSPELRAGRIDRHSLWYQFLNTDATDFPKAAIRIINYFASVSALPRWLAHPLEFLDG